METVYRDYASKGVQFYYIYKHLQHPGVNGFVEPVSIEEKVQHVKEFRRRTRSQIPWLCDTLDHQLKRAMGGSPNSDFVIDPDGKIVAKRFWSNPRELRRDLERLVGPVENPTQVSDIDVQFQVEERKIASGVVPRLSLPGRMATLKVEPIKQSTDKPFYVKLRVEAEPNLIRRNKGKLYLGFFLDPVYQVHWNNRAGNISFQLEAADGIDVSPLSGEGPEVSEDADIDPREFLLDVQLNDVPQPMIVTVNYVACDDANTFCLPVEQKYRVHFKMERNGGTRALPMYSSMFDDLMEYDTNKDGVVQKEELPEGRRSLFLGHIDRNADETIDQQEFADFMQMIFGKPKEEQKPPSDQDGS